MRRVKANPPYAGRRSGRYSATGPQPQDRINFLNDRSRDIRDEIWQEDEMNGDKTLAAARTVGGDAGAASLFSNKPCPSGVGFMAVSKARDAARVMIALMTLPEAAP